MDQAQAKPPKKRRRWKLATLVVALVTLIAWFWPRGDARFVGKWNTLFVAPGVVVNQKECVVELRRSGTATKYYSDGRSRPFVWTTDGDAFIEGWPTTSQPVNTVVGTLCQGVGWNASSAYWIGSKIKTQTDNAFELSRPVTFSQAKFIRIPE